MSGKRDDRKHKLTVSLDRQVIRKIKNLAARRSTSVGNFLAGQIKIMVDKEDAYERAERQAIALLEQGFHLGGRGNYGRSDLYSL
jgi:hypothetical protein